MHSKSSLSLLVGAVLVSTLICCLPTSGNTQTSQGGVPRLGFAVPEAPAFTLLSTDDSKILRPATIKDLALSLSTEKSIAVELAPAKLIHGQNLTLKQYQARPWLYRTALSIGAEPLGGSERARQIAVGVRMTIFDKADLRTNKEFLQAEQVYLNKMLAIDTAAIGPLDDAPNYTPEHLAQLTAIEQELVENRRRFQDKYWNASTLQWATAIRWNSADSSGGEPELSAAALWITGGLAVGVSGQWLFGLTGSAEKDSLSEVWRGTASASTRFYVGSNRLKGFAEVQASISKPSPPVYLLNAGGEYELLPGLWATASAGFERSELTNDHRLVTGFAFHAGTDIMNK